MLWLWRFFVGYLTIKINRLNGENVLNRAAANGINIWNLYYNDGYIYGNVSARNFIKLYSVRHDIKCKIKIIKKYGIYFNIKKHKNRIGFMSGIIIFFLLLLHLNSYIWIINVEGNHLIPSSQIINSCKEIGIHEGLPKYVVNNKYAAQKLQLRQQGIAWCSLNVEGCVLTVNLSEIDVLDKDNNEFPSNIKSLIDGKIKKIDVTSGNVLIKVNDIVSKGDLLVSGIIDNLTGTIFVHSNGKIIAETNRVFSSQGDFIQTKYEETGKTIKHYTINFFGKNIPLYLGKIKKSYNYEYDIKYLKIFNKKTPIKIICEQYKLTKKTIKRFDEKALKKILYEDICKQVKKYDFINVMETNREIINTDRGILLKINYICEEDIAIEDKIILSKEN